MTTQNTHINPSDSQTARSIKTKLNEHGGAARIRLLNGGLCDIAFDENGRGLTSSKIPPRNQLTWEAFDAVVELLRNNHGKATKGNARMGKLGSDKLPVDSVEGYIAYKVHGVPIGGSAFGPGFVIAAVLEWAGICSNERGYLLLK